MTVEGRREGAVARWTVREMRALASSGLQKYREPPAASSEAWQPRLPVGSRSTAPGVSLFTAEIESFSKAAPPF